MTYNITESSKSQYINQITATIQDEKERGINASHCNHDLINILLYFFNHKNNRQLPAASATHMQLHNIALSVMHPHAPYPDGAPPQHESVYMDHRDRNRHVAAHSEVLSLPKTFTSLIRQFIVFNPFSFSDRSSRNRISLLLITLTYTSFRLFFYVIKVQ